jgi:hypothetical protein
MEDRNMNSVQCNYIPDSDLDKINKAIEELNILGNSSVDAIFESSSLGFKIWITDDNHPAGWDDVPMEKEGFSKPCILLAQINWIKMDGKVAGLRVETNANILGNHLRQNNQQGNFKCMNRLEDIQWAIEKILQLFKWADVITPTISFDSSY